jgi:hypothetical protein
MKVKCKRCKHLWEYKGEKTKLMKKYPQYISCPICNTSVKLQEKKSDIEDKN